jgi:hypothetical protein
VIAAWLGGRPWSSSARSPLRARAILASLKPMALHGNANEIKMAGQDWPWGYWLLFSIHRADDLVRTGQGSFCPSCCATRAQTC